MEADQENADFLAQFPAGWQQSNANTAAPSTPATPPAYGMAVPVQDPEQPVQAAAPPPIPPNNSGGGQPTIANVIISFNGTAYYCTLNGVVGSPV